MTSDALVAALAGSRYVLLGERHDNPDHHRVQAALVRALLAAGRRPTVAFEMFTPDDAPAMARHLAAAPRDAAGLGEAVDWKRSGWPTGRTTSRSRRRRWTPACPIVAANLTPATARALARGNRAALAESLAARHDLDRPLPGGGHAALTAEIDASHCGHLPAERLGGMVLAQRARDATLAESMLGAGQDGAVLIAGDGHVRDDRGVPIYLRAREPAASIATVAPIEVRDGWTRPEDYGAALRRRPAAVRLGVVHAPDGRRRSLRPPPLAGTPPALKTALRGRRGAPKSCPSSAAAGRGRAACPRRAPALAAAGAEVGVVARRRWTWCRRRR